MPFSLTWQHDGNRCLQINESKITCNHARLAALMYLLQQSPERWETQNLFRKITGTSYEIGYLTCKSLRWFIAATMLVCPRFLSEQACMCVCACLCVCVCVGTCRGMWMTACQWKRCHYLADVCVSCDRGQGHITSAELTLRTGNITLWFPH